MYFIPIGPLPRSSRKMVPVSSFSQEVSKLPIKARCLSPRPIVRESAYKDLLKKIESSSDSTHLMQFYSIIEKLPREKLVHLRESALQVVQAFLQRVDPSVCCKIASSITNGIIATCIPSGKMTIRELGHQIIFTLIQRGAREFILQELNLSIHLKGRHKNSIINLLDQITTESSQEDNFSTSLHGAVNCDVSVTIKVCLDNYFFGLSPISQVLISTPVNARDRLSPLSWSKKIIETSTLTLSERKNVTFDFGVLQSTPMSAISKHSNSKTKKKNQENKEYHPLSPVKENSQYES